MATSKMPTTMGGKTAPSRLPGFLRKIVQTAQKYPPWVVGVAAFVVFAPIVIAAVIWWDTPGKRSPGRELLDLVNTKNVQDDLSLSEDQLTRLNDLNQRQGQIPASAGTDEIARQAEKGIGKILTKQQAVRLRQIALQMRGIRALYDADVMRALKLTIQQRDEIKAVEDQMSKEMRQFQANQDKNKDNKTKLTEEQQKRRQEQMREKGQELRKAADTKIMDILTPKQQTIWQDMTGEPFASNLARNRGSGGGRRGGG